jgi:hypothetical protein
MSTILIVLLVVIGVALAASFALGRVSHEVESARDTEFLDLEGSWVRYRVMGDRRSSWFTAGSLRPASGSSSRGVSRSGSRSTPST